ncbi:MAG TPA: Rne/Rng family ribonuclease [Nitrospiria bacterium]|jgi:ribonuclease G|nr:Rne/Rng family ribonuclease [Nitrospiria bacterium]
MAIEIVINETREETRVALLENRVVTELYIDRRKEQGIVGNVYKGKASKVLPGMQAAFVDIGQEKAAFLHASDITGAPDEYPGPVEEPTLDGSEEKEETQSLTETETTPRSRRSSSLPIEELLQEGQEVLVQVSKEPMGTKGSRVTTQISLPGRYLVYMPTVNHVGVSRRIARDEERARLKELIMRMRKPGAGYIVRTVSEDIQEDEFRSDIDFLELLWENILKKKERLTAPALLHTDLDLIFRTVRDLFTNRVDRLIIDSKSEYERIRDFVTTYLPHLSQRVELYDQNEPIFDHFEIEMEISKALGRKVWLKSGGYIVIEHTEALTVIDVNTGRYVGKRNQEETILKTNLEAVKEIAYQLRLRNIGGIIIIDFIDMDRERNRGKVYGALQEAMALDRAQTNLLRISELGLVEMSRERTREDLLRVLCEPCSYCEGRSYTKSPTSVCYEIFREIRRLGSSPKEKKIIIGVHPNVAALLYDEERQGVEELEKEFHKKIVIKSDSNQHIEQYDIVTL